ncbi:unnamed protein product [Nesidiocoris tenuis]|uniref:Uncharacterized protein n=1 Tax=Nesidiocoris tenuis TaxID=355587 RepID=A0A6H5FVG4_9HEMI|nr:unnamed protein product [Nesidiocoris tenuis]
MELTDTLELKASSEPQLLNLPSLPTKVFIYATGGGCATVQVPSDCAVCIDFSMRSEFIINRLRPGLARAYPSGRPDLVSEQFFHARRGSPLLAGTSEDDLITWFGTSVFGELHAPETHRNNSSNKSSDNHPSLMPKFPDEMQELESSFLNACKCGQSCESVKPGTTTGSSKTEEEKQNDEINDFTDIIVFSDLREDLFTTQAEFDRMVSEMDENVTRAESSTPDQPLSQEDQTVSTEAYEEEGELYKNYTADSTLTSIFSSPQPDSPPQHLNKSRADLNDSASHKTDGSPVNSSTANDSTVDHPQQNLPPVLNAFLSSKVNAKSLGKNYVGEKNSKEHFEIRTGEETVNSQLKFAISDGAVSSELPLLQPLKSAELVKAKSSGLLKVSPALVG